MNLNGFNLVSVEKFDEALNHVNSLSSCNISNAMSVFNSSGLPSGYDEISNGIVNIKDSIDRLANGAGPEGLIDNYKSGYSGIKNAIIEAYIAEYKLVLENGNFEDALSQLGQVEKNKFKSEFNDILKNMSQKNSNIDPLLQYASLTEFFKDVENTFTKFASKYGDETFDATDLQPKNNRDIAHRGYTPGGILDNSAEGFRLAGEKGFWGCEADIRFDANGNLVCSHNSVKNGENPTTFEEYLDICKEYGMTAIIDLKYEKGPNNPDENLSTSILKTIKEKGMMDTCVLQTNNPIDISYIRENSSNARIWYLTDVISDKNVKLIEENNVECVNTSNTQNNAYKINKLIQNGVDVCVWNVQTESKKNSLLNMGAKYVMSDNVLGITPYENGENNLNNLKHNLEDIIVPTLLKTNVDKTIKSNLKDVGKVTLLGTNVEENPNSDATIKSSNNLTSGARLTAPMGHIDGPEAYETWYDLGMSKVVENMEKLYGYTNLKSSVRSDGVKVLSGTAPDGTTFNDLVMVAADVRHESANPNGTYERGEIVDTTLGKGIVVDACGEAIRKRKNNEGVHFDIATAWHTQPYQAQAYSKNSNAQLGESVNNVTINNNNGEAYKLNSTTDPKASNSNVASAGTANAPKTSSSANAPNNTYATQSNSSSNLGTNASTSGGQLTAPMGHIEGPEAEETWYDLGMSTVVENMEKDYGYTNVKASIRSDGVKVLSGTAPDGTTFKDLVMVAADVRHEASNPNGTYERGQIVDTTLGKGIVVDACRLAITKRENNKGNHFDIATAWHTQPYQAQAYSKNNNVQLGESVNNVTINNNGEAYKLNSTTDTKASNSNAASADTVNVSKTSSSANTPNNTYATQSNSSNIGVNTLSANSSTAVTNILPNNKFSDAIPQISSGNLGSVETGKNSINYELYNVSDNAYSDYVKALIDKGYTMTDYGKFVKDNCEVITNITNDGNMSISFIQN